MSLFPKISKKPTLAEQFKVIPTRQINVDTLTQEEKTCPICGTQMIPIGTELIRSEIVYTPPKLERIKYMATTYSCPESLLAYIIYRKYGLYIPLYRQEQDFLQMNAPIGRTSMAHWIIIVDIEYMEPGFYLMADAYQGYNKAKDEFIWALIGEDASKLEHAKQGSWAFRRFKDMINHMDLRSSGMIFSLHYRKFIRMGDFNGIFS